MDTENTMIRISKEARDELKAIGKKGETYDKVIRRLLKNAKGDNR